MEKSVINSDKLAVAEKAIEAEYTKLVESVALAVNNIGEVTLESEPLIVAARTQYDESISGVKARFPSEILSKLIEAEDKLKQLKIEAVAAPAIAAIENISLDNEQTINTARNTYNELPDEAKAYVHNYESLTLSESEYKRITEEKAKQAEMARIQEEQSKKQQEEQQSSVGSTVYWTSNGAVYHPSPNCATLKKSKNVHSGTIGQSGKSRACKVCG